MNESQINMWWVAGLLIFIAIGIIAMLWRNRAAKTDTVLHTKKDANDSSVSLDPKKNTRKLD